MSLKYMGVPDRCRHGDFEGKCMLCCFEDVGILLKTMRDQLDALVSRYQRFQETQGKVELKLIYFKESGKYYTHSELLVDRSSFPGCIYPGDYVRELRKREQLPGLIGGYWDGPILVETGYPQLILPEVSENTKG